MFYCFGNFVACPTIFVCCAFNALPVFIEVRDKSASHLSQTDFLCSCEGLLLFLRALVGVNIYFSLKYAVWWFVFDIILDVRGMYVLDCTFFSVKFHSLDLFLVKVREFLFEFSVWHRSIPNSGVAWVLWGFALSCKLSSEHFRVSLNWQALGLPSEMMRGCHSNAARSCSESAILSDFKGVPVGVCEIWRKDVGCVVKKTSGGCFVYSD